MSGKKVGNTSSFKKIEDATSPGIRGEGKSGAGTN